jgi:hypothetical protein
LPNVIAKPADDPLSGSKYALSSFFSTPAHAGFGLPAPGRLVLIPTAFDDTVVMSRPPIVSLSPGLTVVR